VLKAPIVARDRTFAFTAVSMGNPHAVIFVEDAAADLMALAKTYGPTLETDPTFPRRTNVEFARVRKGAAGTEIDLVVWERGVGITLACGTGACATAVAAALEGRAPAGQAIPVHLPGGTLFITVVPEKEGTPGNGPSFAGVTMRGPAVTVFQVDIDLARLTAGEKRA
jgi:diaminopimelate epimerase